MTPEYYRALAEQLASGPFRAFFSDAVISRSGGFDYETQSDANPQTQTVKAFRNAYDMSRVAGTMIQAGDVELYCLFADLQWQPSPSDTRVSFEGEEYTVVSVSNHADVLVTLQLRRL